MKYMFKDSKEGQTHFINDGCGESEHNDMCNNETGHDFRDVRGDDEGAPVLLCRNCGLTRG